MVYDYRIITKPQEYLSTLLDKGFDPAQTALLEKDPGVLKNSAPASFRVDMTSSRNNSTELKVSTSRDGLLVVSESWYPGWKVFVDGKETELLKADLVLKAVALTAGEHIVRFVYSPSSFKLGAAISLAGIALSIFIFVFG
jgi:uncharacterized membrane protein YfhO